MNSVSIPHFFFFQFQLPRSYCSFFSLLQVLQRFKVFSVVGFNVSEDGDYSANSFDSVSPSALILITHP